MRKIIWLLICFLCVNFGIEVNAEEQSGFIFKIEESEVSMFSMLDEEKFVSLGDGLYSTSDINDAYDYIGKENILTVFPDYELELFDLNYSYALNDENYSEQWYLETIDYEFAKDINVTGKDIKIAVIDSGLNIEHPDLDKNKILEGYNCIADDTATDIVDNYGHGTQVTGVIAAQINNELDIAGIAHNAYIIPIKITDGKTLKLSSFFLGLNKAIECECDVINLSLGGKFTDETALTELKACVDKAVENGIVVVSAVGNYGGTDVYYPAGLDNVIGVGAIDSDLNVSSFSQKNESVFVVAPGRDILTLSNKGDSVLASGTSIATPMVTSFVALIKEAFPDYCYEEISTLLSNTANDKGEEGYDTSYGYGIINIKTAFDKVQEEIPKITVEKLEDIEEGTISVFIEDGKAIQSGILEISYNNEEVEITGVNKGELLWDFAPLIEIDEQKNRITVSWENNESYLETGILITVDFKLKESIIEYVQFKIENCNLYDENENKIWAIQNSGGIEINNQSVIKGDIYSDGIVNIKDLIRLNQYVAKWEMELTKNELNAADIVADGEINSKDLIRLNQYLARWNVTLD